MPARRCHHGENAPRYTGGRCKLCTRARSAQRTQTIGAANLSRLYRAKQKTCVRCVCGKPLIKNARPDQEADLCPGKSFYCSDECREKDTFQTTLRIYNLLQEGKKR